MNKSFKRSLVAKVIKEVADRMAKISYGTASGWGAYQPKEPEKIKKKTKMLL